MTGGNGKQQSSASWNGLMKVAIVGASSLKGKEVKEALEESNFPAREIVLLDDEQSSGQLESVGEEVTFIHQVTRSSFDRVDMVFFAGEESFTRAHWQAARDAGCAVVDLSYALDAQSVAVRSPWVEKELAKAVERNPTADLATDMLVAAHPAATALAIILLRAQRTGAVKRTVVNLYEPVSEQGKAGMDELHQQTLNLLNFHPLPKGVYDAQVAFNMLPRLGQEVRASLERSQERILKHLKLITQSRVELPPLQVLQAPVFHGYTASVFMELERSIVPADFALALEGEHVTVVPQTEDPPNNVSSAGQETIGIVLRRDASSAHGIWLWMAADNLKLHAVTAQELGLELGKMRPSGKIQ